jgi:hypothetical protein
MSKSQKISLIIIGVLIVGIQFIPVDRSNPEVLAEINAPENVKNILARSCYDCHSNQTNWPWYSYVAPVSWLIAGDVKDGRRHLNFSEWESLNAAEKKKAMEEIWQEIDDGEMPLGIYTLIHSEALISAADMNVLSKWTQVKSDTLWP